MNMKIITRQQAAELGRTFFYTGGFCKRGHKSTRYVLNGNCRMCVGTRGKENYNRMRLLKQARNEGMASVTVQVHPEDVKKIEGMALALRVDRA